MRVKDYNLGYCVIAYQYWNEYGEDAYVDYWCTDIDEAIKHKNALERADGIFFVVVSCRGV